MPLKQQLFLFEPPYCVLLNAVRYCLDFLCLDQINISRRCLRPVLDHSIIVAGVCMVEAQSPVCKYI